MYNYMFIIIISTCAPKLYYCLIFRQIFIKFLCYHKVCFTRCLYFSRCLKGSLQITLNKLLRFFLYYNTIICVVGRGVIVIMQSVCYSQVKAVHYLVLFIYFNIRCPCPINLSTNQSKQIFQRYFDH